MGNKTDKKSEKGMSIKLSRITKINPREFYAVVSNSRKYFSVIRRTGAKS